MRPITILYEDQLSPERKSTNYGPHVFFEACVADSLGMLPAELRPRKFFDAHPCKGVQNVRRELARNIDLLRAGGAPVVTIVDGDRLHEQLGVPREAPPDQVERSFLDGLSDPSGVHLLVLDRNLETVIRHLGLHDASLGVEAALRKDLVARDALLQKAARDDRRELRQAALGEGGMRSAREIVDRLASLVRTRLESPPG